LVEIVGEAGIVVDIAPENYREAFVRLAGDPDLRNSLAVKARERSVGFDGGVMEEREKDLYLRLIDQYAATS